MPKSNAKKKDVPQPIGTGQTVAEAEDMDIGVSPTSTALVSTGPTHKLVIGREDAETVKMLAHLYTGGKQNLTVSDIAKIMITGSEIGLPTTMALMYMHMINDKPSLSGQGMLAILMNCPFITVELPDLGLVKDSVAVTITRHDKPNPQSLTTTFTRDHAQTAGLLNKDPWKKYPQNMMLWRALSNCARMIAPDVIGGMHLTEEMQPGDQYNADAEPITIQSAAERQPVAPKPAASSPAPQPARVDKPYDQWDDPHMAASTIRTPLESTVLRQIYEDAGVSAKNAGYRAKAAVTRLIKDGLLDLKAMSYNEAKAAVYAHYWPLIPGQMPSFLEMLPRVLTVAPSDDEVRDALSLSSEQLGLGGLDDITGYRGTKHQAVGALVAADSGYGDSGAIFDKGGLPDTWHADSIETITEYAMVMNEYFDSRVEAEHADADPDLSENPEEK